MKLVSVATMRAVEQQADAHGLTYAEMMANAGRNLAEEVRRLVPEEEEKKQVVGLVGAGNNGGDTLVALSHLAQWGWKAHAYLVQRRAEGDELVHRLEQAGGTITLAHSDSGFARLRELLASTDVLLDGLLGTGFKPPLKKEIGAVLTATRLAIEALAWPPLVVAVDCSSGVDCDSGEAASECLAADVTVTMAAVKHGLLKMPAYALTGELRTVDIGVLDDLPAWQGIHDEVMDENLAQALLPLRPLDAHKGTFGTVVVAAGSVNYTGAVLLAGRAAYRAGAGLVTLAIPTPLHAALAGQFPEATWLLLPHELGVIAADAAEVLIQHLGRASALLLGPGLGVEETTAEFVAALLAGTEGKAARGQIGFVPRQEKQEEKSPVLPPLVVDADGLKLLTKVADWPRRLPAGTILTPHPGEMAVLTGLTVTAIQGERLETARRFAAEWGQVVVLKGAFTVIAAPDGRTTTIPVATPALARAGTGDVLAGLIAGLRAQGVEAYDAARLAAWIHAQAGLRAAEWQGSPASVLAGDVVEMIPHVLAALEACRASRDYGRISSSGCSGEVG